ncbi:MULTISPECIES: RES family NAD+ phosphorylase [unclassified Rhizobium]|uniref:RES family NAD+ phosphorylase n=1 Tax=unclassified Rhizobium TaxID=2613769 RepID=UPI001ADA8AAD|nr:MULTISPECIES: RES family NAD+ phosphorylase [unclassified Rhizobium]MBO9102196.1 RES family NAD+ phosphorylase [Rhizobium sp. L58/93]MBO9172292.1 RES family NAD+ phosphorylase [Rhizobium sp. L245/93]MBO9188041.1 RES family NAD+ phosphorylase [Rhizobium sp. E27B/91]QXZ86300.1 RES family NAD+ phosphorylase [Rhizobium sp. K1/93]QXZ92245.1 RES family NAD+ phosphorylase [Rhizobium sp. K15/93]
MPAAWRIAADTPDYEADDLTGTGAKVTGGRWNAPGFALLYCAENISLAAMETLVHFAASSLPLNRYLVRIDIPQALWDASERLDAKTAPVGWDALPAGRASLAYGSTWLAERRSACLFVPSVIVSDESNVLVNPLHPDARKISATKVRRWLYDSRLKSKT